MKKTILILLSLVSVAAVAATPYIPEVDARFSALEKKQEVRVTYDVALKGGTVAAHGLGQFLPAKSVIVRDYLYIDTAFTDGGAGTVAFSCEDANNLKTATDLTAVSAGQFVEGAATGGSAAFVSGIGSACEITATVAGSTQSTGKATLWLEYIKID